MRRAFFATIAIVLVCTGYASAAAAQYAVDGTDDFTIGTGDIASRITYAGRQVLTIERHGRLSRMSAVVTYARSDGAATTQAHGEFVADVKADGSVVASADRDPDNLTVLNQPFAADLDPQTLADLRRLSRPIPFDFPSPLTGSSLHGYLAHLPPGVIDGRPTVGVRFEAFGPMTGALPDRPNLRLVGKIAMRGTAYYDAATSLLVSLSTTVTIRGNVDNRASKDPVTIVYERRIAADAAPRRTADRAR